jgi:S1-C subfamily serine protease
MEKLKRIYFLLILFLLQSFLCFSNDIFNKEIKFTLSPKRVKTFETFEKGIISFMSHSIYSKKPNYSGIIASNSNNSNDEKLLFKRVEYNDSAELNINYEIIDGSFLKLSISTRSTEYSIISKIEVTTNGNKFIVEPILKKMKNDFDNYFEKSIVDAIEFRFTSTYKPKNIIEGIWATDDGYKSIIISSKFSSNNNSESYNWISLLPNSLFETIGTIKNSSSSIYQFSYRIITQYNGSINFSNPLINKIMVIEKPIFEAEKYSYQTGERLVWIKVSSTSNEDMSRLSNTVNPIGTAFSIGENYIATNYHVIDELKNIYIKSSLLNDKLLLCNVIINDKINDISVLKVVDTSFKSIDSLPYNLATRNILLGEEVYAFGFPLNNLLGNGLKLTNGTINSKNGFQDNFSNFQFSANIYPGNSGGPLISKEAEVIGITVAKLKGTEMINYAIKIDYLLYLSKSVENYNFSNYFDSKKSFVSLPKSAELISKYIYNIYGN